MMIGLSTKGLLDEQINGLRLGLGLQLRVQYSPLALLRVTPNEYR